MKESTSLRRHRLSTDDHLSPHHWCAGRTPAKLPPVPSIYPSKHELLSSGRTPLACCKLGCGSPTMLGKIFWVGGGGHTMLKPSQRLFLRMWCMDRMFELVSKETFIKLDEFVFTARRLHSYRASGNMIGLNKDKAKEKETLPFTQI